MPLNVGLKSGILLTEETMPSRNRTTSSWPSFGSSPLAWSSNPFVGTRKLTIWYLEEKKKNTTRWWWIWWFKKEKNSKGELQWLWVSFGLVVIGVGDAPSQGPDKPMKLKVLIILPESFLPLGLKLEVGNQSEESWLGGDLRELPYIQRALTGRFGNGKDSVLFRLDDALSLGVLGKVLNKKK